MFESLVHLVSGSAWTYAVILGVAALDAFFPFVPSETIVITAGVIAARGDLSIELVILLAAAGATLGDNISYLGGRTLGQPLRRRFMTGERSRRGLEWAQRQLDERGGYVIVIARFIPGGRTATTFTAGLTRYPWPRFLAFDVLAGLVWATYAGLLGYVGGVTFKEHPWQGLVVAFVIALSITGAVELYRHLRRA